MFERFTDRARRVVVLAQEEAPRLRVGRLPPQGQAGVVHAGVPGRGQGPGMDVGQVLHTDLPPPGGGHSAGGDVAADKLRPQVVGLGDPTRAAEPYCEEALRRDPGDSRSALALAESAGGTARALAAVQRFGLGRTMIFTGEASWRWRMQLPSSDRTYETFWRQAVRWLAA